MRTKKVDFNVVKIRGVNEVLENLEKRTSDWQRLEKILATVLKVLQQKSFKKVEVSIVDLHLQLAESLMIRHTQQREFQEEILSLETSKPSQEFGDNAGKAVQGKRSKRKLGRLFRFDPFLDEHSILRVGGRLRRSLFDVNLKHPVLLPQDGFVTNLIIKFCHERVHHAGRGMTSNEVWNSGFWVLHGS